MPNEPYPLHADPQINERCEVCGTKLRAQGEYRYCPKQGLVGHIRAESRRNTDE